MTDTGHPAWPNRRIAGILASIAVDRQVLAVLAATLVGLALRLAATTGDLGLDEVWSLRLVTKVHSVGEVFWGISHDNNHFLNSVWLFAVGQDRAGWVYRLPAVVFGTLTVPAMARWLGRGNPEAGSFAAILAAVALPLVDFGSEARGYAGLVLASVLAIDECGRATDAALSSDQDRAPLRPAAWRLGLAVGFGALCHPAMMATVAVVGLTTLIRVAFRSRRIATTIAVTTRIFWPSGVLVLPAVLAIAAGVLNVGRFTLGDFDPFSWAKLADGFGGMLLITSGMPDAWPGMAGAAAGLLFVAVVARCRLIASPVIALAVAALVVLPAAAAAARLQNVGYPRYFAVCGIVLLAVQAETLGRLWQAGGRRRWWAVAGASALCAGGLTLDGLLIRDGRGHFSETLAIMQTEGAPFYTSSHPAMASMLLDGVAQGTGRPAVSVAAGDFCRTGPDWYLAVGLYDPRPDAVVTVGPAACRTVYRVRAPFLASPLSGTQWTLFRRS